MDDTTAHSEMPPPASLPMTPEVETNDKTGISTRPVDPSSSADPFGLVAGVSSEHSRELDSTMAVDRPVSEEVRYRYPNYDHLESPPVYFHPEGKPEDRPEGEPEGLRVCLDNQFRFSDPFSPAQYQCQDYDINAEWFDGRGTTELRCVIDLENATMDR
jgi:hypothetical protein